MFWWAEQDQGEFHLKLIILKYCDTFKVHFSSKALISTSNRSKSTTSLEIPGDKVTYNFASMPIWSQNNSFCQFSYICIYLYTTVGWAVGWVRKVTDTSSKYCDRAWVQTPVSRFSIFQTCVKSLAAKDFPTTIRAHAWTRYEDSFLIAGGRGEGEDCGAGKGPGDFCEYDTIYRLGIP